MTLKQLRSALRQAARPEDAVVLQRFFKTGPGQYGEGDVFLGVRVPASRRLAREADDLSEQDVVSLLRSQFHEERLLALLMLVRRFERGSVEQQRRIFELYLAETRWINNWDLVDLSAPNIVGAWLLDRPRGLLRKLVKSASLWERRIAILATFTFIRAGSYDDTLVLCRMLLKDPHDLMHKACGWMLREVGKRDRATLDAFLEQHADVMPRTQLRYAIEKHPAKERRAWLERGSIR